MPPCDVWLYIEAKQEEAELQMQSEYEVGRAICWNIHLHSQAKKKISGIMEFMPFPWDSKTQAAQVESIKESFLKDQELIKRLKQKK